MLVATIQEDMNRVLEFIEQWQREEALVLLAHTIVINLCRRRETLPETLHDVDQVFDQIKNLVKWNYGNIRDAGEEGVYYFADPAQVKKSMQ